jgi:hypothetical protein
VHQVLLPESDEVLGCWQHQFLSITFFRYHDSFPHWSQSVASLSLAQEEKRQQFCQVLPGVTAVLLTQYIGDMRHLPWSPETGKIRSALKCLFNQNQRHTRAADMQRAGIGDSISGNFQG